MQNHLGGEFVSYTEHLLRRGIRYDVSALFGLIVQILGFD
jgi:hypothetical protein